MKRSHRWCMILLGLQVVPLLHGCRSTPRWMNRRSEAVALPSQTPSLSVPLPSEVSGSPQVTVQQNTLLPTTKPTQASAGTFQLSSYSHDSERLATNDADSHSEGILHSVAPRNSIEEDAPTPSSETQSIDLTTALLLTSGQSPQIAFAKARIDESLSQYDRAQAMKLPSLRAGINYNKHEGRIQDIEGNIVEVSRGSLYSGLGAGAVGAGSPAVPGIVSQFHVADAVFQPRIAQQTWLARRAGAEAATNDALYATAIAYIALLHAQQTRAITQEAFQQAEELARTTDEFAKAGEGLEADHDRAKTEVALRKAEDLRAQESVQVAAARLAELVRWDGPAMLEAQEVQIHPIDLIDASQTSQMLVAQALSSRPELAECRHYVCEACERLNRERHAPLMPSVLLAGSYGGLTGGVGGNFVNGSDRFDADAMAYWEVRQLGFGENAIRKESRARVQQARQKEIAQLDRIAREVIEAHVQVTSRKLQMQVAADAVTAAQNSYQRNWDRIRNRQGLPLEVLQSMQALATAQREYAKVVADYNSSQFALCRALGWPSLSIPESSSNKSDAP
ncbi:MAG: TolC family protein [Pirellulales bacterium]